MIYRPPSAAASAAFFDELSDLLDRLATIVEPIYVVGDCNAPITLMTQEQCSSATHSPPTVLRIV